MTPPPDVPAVDPVEATRRLDAGSRLLDVREADEWDAGHAAGAVWIPLGDLAVRQGDVPAEPLVVVCRSGVRSARAVAALRAAGYDAVNLAGGMRAWEAAGMPVVTDGGDTGRVA